MKLGFAATARALLATLCALVVAPYVAGWVGFAVVPGLVVAISVAAGVLVAAAEPTSAPSTNRDPFWLWATAVGATGTWLAALSWPAFLPPGGGSDLTHHLVLVDVIDHTRRLVESSAGAALAEMAHYTPGLHLVVVVIGAVLGVDAWRVAYPLVLATVALKAGFVCLIAHRALDGARARGPLAAAAVLFVLFVPRAYSVGGFLQSGYLAQVAAELFVIAGWWALTTWHDSPTRGRMALVGLAGAAAFLVWPIWIGPLMLAATIAVLHRPRPGVSARVRDAAWAAGPVVIVAAMHLSRHAAWLSQAGTSGAVPAFRPDAPLWILLGLATVGFAGASRRDSMRVLVWFVAALALQAAALLVVARWRGAETPYLAVKMIYLAAYPVAVLAVVGVARLVSTLPPRAEMFAGWACAAVIGVTAARLASAFVVPAAVVSTDLHAAGAWARAALAPACVEYVVANGDTAYWLHLAVMGNPRVTQRTADLDRYSLNAVVGQWIEGTGLPYAVADLQLVPAEVRATTQTVRMFGGAAVIGRPSKNDDPPCGVPASAPP